MGAHRLQTNIPVSGTLKAAYYAKTNQPGKYSDQINLWGNWDGGIGQASVYVDLKYLDQLQRLGIVMPTGGTDRDGFPAYAVGQAHFSLCKKDRAPMEISLLNGQAPPQATAPPQQQATQPPRQQAQTPQQGSEPAHVRVARLNATMASCLKAAILAWKEATGCDEKTAPPVDWSTISSTAHCLFIQRSRDGLLSPPPKAALPLATSAQREAMNTLAGQCGINIGEFIARMFQGKTADQLTEPEAQRVVAQIRLEIEERDRAKREQEAAEAAREMPMADNSGVGDANEDW